MPLETGCCLGRRWPNHLGGGRRMLECLPSFVAGTVFRDKDEVGEVTAEDKSHRQCGPCIGQSYFTYPAASRMRSDTASGWEIIET